MARFLHLSDLHVVAEGTTSSGVLDTRSVLSSTIDHIIEMLPGLSPIGAVLVSGDISDDGTQCSYEFARAQLDRLGLPIFSVPGNHDKRSIFREVFCDFMTLPKSGSINWEAEIAGTQVIGLDTLVEGSGSGAVDENGLALLTSTLAHSNKSPTVVLMHHPPFLTGIKFMDAIGLTNIGAMTAALATENRSLIVLAGHVHGVHHCQLSGHPVVTAPSICSAFALNRQPDAFVGFFESPTGFAVLDTGAGYHWSAVPTSYFGGPHAF